ncbi:methylenetetrahydrofolate reductase (NADPH) [Diorhabda carinulata]|uniref:methylenetetrahydrofolate reductase (NADPH) n=1 Tax=Diorhabda carinulata TaxID=1163345 RepID=UPI0025A180F6|nr:methylenetetrahydrofolate reductase (NADPH) [Diorhabda carinulata]
MREILVRNDNESSLVIKPKKEIKTELNLYKYSDTSISIEICPNRQLDSEVLSTIPCSFYSITWRTPSEEELDHVERIPAIILAKQLIYNGYNVLLHLAGRNLKIKKVIEILDYIKDVGIKNIFALQGDASEIRENDDKKYDFPYASDLVKFIRKYYGNFFTIGVAGYPEKHPKSENKEKDLEYLKYKVSCGADFIITQSSYQYQHFSSFVQRCRDNGITLPIIPGLFIISSYKTLMAMAKFCGVPIPDSILHIIESNKNDDEAVKQFGIIQAAHLMQKIINNKEYFGGVHVFSLNNLELLRNVLKKVNVDKQH